MGSTTPESEAPRLGRVDGRGGGRPNAVPALVAKTEASGRGGSETKPDPTHEIDSETPKARNLVVAD